MSKCLTLKSENNHLWCGLPPKGIDQGEKKVEKNEELYSGGHITVPQRFKK